MALFAEYSPKDVVVSWNGINITGFAEDSFIRLSRNSDLVERVVGAGGDVSLTKIADRTGTVEIELMQTSPTNALLSAFAVAQESIVGLDGISNFSIVDPSGSVLAVAINAWLEAYPDVDLGSGQTSRTWTFGCERLEYIQAPS